MVLFENLKVGCRVQTNWKGCILKGTVRYKGGLITRDGDWIGVELDEPAGDNSGLFKGRKYFQCNAKHGIFIQPRRLHLLGNWRTMSANSYKTVNKESFTDETLFARKTKDPLTSKICSNQKLSFHKQHLVGHRLSPAKSSTELSTFNSDRTSSRSSKHLNHFVPSSPSIPNIHVPRTVLKRMVKAQYFGTSLPRQNTLY